MTPLTYLVVVADTHAGHRLALMNPDTTLFEINHEGEVIEANPELSESQRMEWELYTKSIQQIQELAGGNDIVGLHNGDLTWGHKYKDQLVSTSLRDQLIIAENNMLPLVSLPTLKTFRFASGTDSHLFYEASSELTVAHCLQSRFPEKDIGLVFHGLMEVNGVLIDYAHHGPVPGSRQWFRGDDARRYARNLCFQEYQDGNRVPDVIIRAHYHEYVIERVPINGHEVLMILCPSFSMMNHHALQATKSAHKIHIGMFVLTLQEGKIVGTHDFIKKFDIRTKEVL